MKRTETDEENYIRRRNNLLKEMKRQTDAWLLEDKQEAKQKPKSKKGRKPKNKYDWL